MKNLVGASFDAGMNLFVALHKAASAIKKIHSPEIILENVLQRVMMMQ